MNRVLVTPWSNCSQFVAVFLGSLSTDWSSSEKCKCFASVHVDFDRKPELRLGFPTAPGVCISAGGRGVFLERASALSPHPRRSRRM
eukprot:5091324-Pleurochrysis_carterae.AAC.1